MSAFNIFNRLIRQTRIMAEAKLNIATSGGYYCGGVTDRVSRESNVRYFTRQADIRRMYAMS